LEIFGVRTQDKFVDAYAEKGMKEMNCPNCGAWSSVKETRSDKAKTMYRRRRECANGHKFTTEEKIVVSEVKCKEKQNAS
jgi:transcriptional regulator NrdR family protein